MNNKWDPRHPLLVSTENLKEYLNSGGSVSDSRGNIWVPNSPAAEGKPCPKPPKVYIAGEWEQPYGYFLDYRKLLDPRFEALFAALKEEWEAESSG